MKQKMFWSLLVALLVIPSFAFAGKPIPFDNLPGQAQDFIKTYFKAADVVYVERDYDREDRSYYEVKFNNGNKIEFDKSGFWTEINCKHTSVPTAVVPNAILEVMNLKYPGKEIAKIELDRRGYEVRVKNGPELHFDLNYVLIYVDD